MRRQFRWDKKYLYWGITALLVLAARDLLNLILVNLPDLRAGFDKVLKILSPFVWGFVISYLIAPLMKCLEKYVFGPLGRRLFPKKGGRKLARGLSVAVAELVLVAVLVGLVYLIIPQLAKKIGELYSRRQEYADAVQAYIRDFEIRHPEIYQYVGDSLNMVTGDISSWVNRLLPTISNYLTSILESAYVILRGVYNLIIGIVVSVYVLSDLEHFTASVRRWTYSVFKVEFAEKLRDAIAYTDRTFMGFITGKLLDSAIIGLLCYIGCSILRIDEPLLISAIVGVTNVIPFFGPFIGAVPCVIILMTKPIQCLIFIIFIIILQQIDGNIIGPKIMGSAIGITGFWVLFAIVAGAGLFGFGGMLLGVPVFVVIYTFLNSRVEARLKRNDLPFETEQYQDLDHIDPVTRQPVKRAHEQPEKETGEREAGKEKKEPEKEKKEDAEE